MKKNPFLLTFYTLLLITLIKGIFWSGLIPAWQAPDEQNHFSLSQFFAETGKVSVHPKYHNTVSAEILSATNLMNLDWSGVHPVWRPQFSNTALGPNEEKVINIKKEERKTFILKGNGRKSPPIYFILGGMIYTIFSPFDILVRLYMMRFLSIILGVLTVAFSYFLVKEIYPARNFLALTVASLVSFHPSFNFVTSTFSPDAGVIFLATLFSFFGVKYLKKTQTNFKDNLSLLVISFLGILTKATFIPLSLVGVLAIIFREILAKSRKNNIVIVLIFFVALAVLYFVFSPSFGFLKDLLTFLSFENFKLLPASLVAYFKAAIPYYNGQVFSWYWAVFGWLEVSLPVEIYRALKLLTIISIIGVGLQLLMEFYRKTLKNSKIILFLALVLIFLYFGIFFFDWQTFARTGELFGFQGRHFLAPISIHMLILSAGLTVFWKKFQSIIFLLLINFFIFINLFSTFTIVNYFYPAGNFTTFVKFASQYKPIFFKFPAILIFGAFYLLLLVLFLFQLVFLFTKADKKNEIG